MFRRVFAIILVITAAPALAQQSDQVQQLLQEINLLTNTVADQGRRLEMLERELRGKPLTSETSASTPTQSRASTTAASWHDRNSWSRVKSGMSEAQVTSILGRPTSAEGVGSGYVTLFYRGEVSGSVSVSGNIKLSDDRVYLVNIPVF